MAGAAKFLAWLVLVYDLCTCKYQPSLLLHSWDRPADGDALLTPKLCMSCSIVNWGYADLDCSKGVPATCLRSKLCSH